MRMAWTFSCLVVEVVADGASVADAWPYGGDNEDDAPDDSAYAEEAYSAEDGHSYEEAEDGPCCHTIDCDVASASCGMACGDEEEVGAAGILTSPCCCDHRKKEVELLRSYSWPWLIDSAKE
jgi:hypothetical protein